VPSLGILQILLMLVLQALAQVPSRPAQLSVSRNPHGTIDIPCENCHTSTSWKPIRGVPEFNHDKTRYPLRGMHEKVQCVQCHTKLVFTNVGSKCADCHADIHRRQFGANCEQCHTVNGWNVSVQAIQNHFNRFPLLGAHASLDCADCHKSAATGQFQGLSTQCYSCHAKDFQRTATLGASVPNHVTSTFSTTCETCHGMNTWVGAKFDHSQTGFPLTGAHVQAACSTCHINNNYNLAGIAPTDCGNSGCHLTTWQQTTNPVHPTAGTAFALANCTTCHTTVSWTTAAFNHSTTGFPLTNGHASVPCASCHINNNYNLMTAPTDCGNSGCHLTTWQQTNNPVHSTAGAQFAATNCAVCHTPVSWTTATFNHSATGFALTGMHVSPSPTPCIACHVSNNYTLSSAACYGCHVAAWQSTATLGGAVPNHITAAFPNDCTLCHTTAAWTGAVFNHAATGFPLTGAHTNTPCASCHINNNYTLTVTTCVSCHLDKYQSTAAPNHAQVGFPTDCTLCHTTTVWQPSTFNHDTTAFPLTGFHKTSVPCASCHVNNNFTTLPTDCYGCHKAVYLATTNPNHVAAGPAFAPANCSSCHTTLAWTGATFNHTWFPVNHGNANGVCATCHTNSADYSIFQCTQCHGGGNAANFHHPNVGGYVYNSVNCYQCHKN
jgi:hypothetical protein